MVARVGLTELWFKQRAVEVLNRIIEGQRLAFDRAEAEQSIKVGRSTVFFDALIWKDRSALRAACELELKQPHTDAADFALVENAARKASALGAPYFLTWNVRDLVLWKTFEEGVPLLQRQSRWWRVVDIDRLDDLTDVHWQRIEKVLEEVLLQLDAVENRGAHFVGLPVDEFFVRKLASAVSANFLAFADALRDRCTQQARFYARIRTWTEEHGWFGLLHPDVAEVDPAAFATLGRLAVFMLMNRVLFYNVVRTHHDELPALSIAKARSGRDVDNRLRSSFDSVLSIDFNTIYGSDIFDDLPVPDDSVPRLKGFIADLQAYDFAAINFEVLGRVYEGLIPPAERHLLGQYFTPSTTVDLINAFCIRRGDDVVLDPACGAGTFLIRAYERLAHLKARGHKALLERLWGIDIAKFPAHIATINLVLPDLGERENFPYILLKDAFSVVPKETEVEVPRHKGILYPARTLESSAQVAVTVPSFDAVVGNPPYIERRNLKPEQRAVVRQAMTLDWGRAVAQFNDSADLYVYFFVHAAAFLKEGGRLGFVTSNGWLDHRYGWDLQKFVLDHFKIVAIIESKVERSFSQAGVNTSITILERSESVTSRDDNVVRFVSLGVTLASLLGVEAPLERAEALVEEVLRVDELAVTPEYRVFPVKQRELREAGEGEEGWEGGRWGAVYLRAPDVYFTLLERGAELLAPLHELAPSVLGTKTGCDAFFYLSKADLGRLGLEEQFTEPVFKSPQNMDAFVLKAAEASDVLVLIPSTKSALAGTSALKYVQLGERKSYQAKGECVRRQRSFGRWYDISAQVQRGKIAFGKTYSERHAVYWNPDECALGGRFVSCSPVDGVDDELLAALLNSSVTALFIEVLGRRSLGQGALDFAVYEAGSLPVIDPRKLDGSLSDRIKRAFREVRSRSPLRLQDEFRDPARQRLDDLVFEAMGLDEGERSEVAAALLRMNQERLAKSRSVEGQPRGKKKAWMTKSCSPTRSRGLSQRVRVRLPPRR